MNYVTLGIVIILICIIMKHSKFRKIRLFFEKLFWIDKFQGEGFLRNFFRFCSKFSMLSYLFIMIWTIAGSLILTDFSMLSGIFFVGIGFPVCYRLVMGFQRYWHDI